MFFIFVFFVVSVFFLYKKRGSKFGKTFLFFSVFSFLLLSMNIYQYYSYKHNVFEVCGCFEKVLTERFGGYIVNIDGKVEVFKSAKYSDFFVDDKSVGRCFLIKYYYFLGSKNIITLSVLKDEIDEN